MDKKFKEYEKNELERLENKLLNLNKEQNNKDESNNSLKKELVSNLENKDTENESRNKFVEQLMQQIQGNQDDDEKVMMKVEKNLFFLHSFRIS